MPIRCSAAFGERAREQFKKLRQARDLRRPRRLGVLPKNSIHLRDVTYLALDEADKMRDMAFSNAPCVRCVEACVETTAQEDVLFTRLAAPGVTTSVSDVLARERTASRYSSETRAGQRRRHADRARVRRRFVPMDVDV